MTNLVLYKFDTSTGTGIIGTADSMASTDTTKNDFFQKLLAVGGRHIVTATGLEKNITALFGEVAQMPHDFSSIGELAHYVHQRAEGMKDTRFYVAGIDSEGKPRILNPRKPNYRSSKKEAVEFGGKRFEDLESVFDGSGAEYATGFLNGFWKDFRKLDRNDIASGLFMAYCLARAGAEELHVNTEYQFAAITNNGVSTLYAPATRLVTDKSLEEHLSRMMGINTSRLDETGIAQFVLDSKFILGRFYNDFVYALDLYRRMALGMTERIEKSRNSEEIRHAQDILKQLNEMVVKGAEAFVARKSEVFDAHGKYMGRKADEANRRIRALRISQERAA